MTTEIGKILFSLERGIEFQIKDAPLMRHLDKGMMDLGSMLEAEQAKVARLREACERLLIGLNENENPDSCGLSPKRWDEEISFARVALEETK